MPYSHDLEQAALPQVKDVLEAVAKLGAS